MAARAWVPPRAVDFVGAGQVDRVQRPWRDTSARGWRTDDHPLDASNLGRDHAHVARGDRRVTPAGDIRADRVHRDVPVPQYDSRSAFDLQVAERLALRLSEVTDLLLREGEGLLEVVGNLVCRGGDLLLRDAERLWRPVVEPLRVFANRGLAVLADVGQNVHDLHSKFPSVGLRDQGGPF